MSPRAWAVMAIAISNACGASAVAETLSVDGNLQLFFDDAIIAEAQNVTREVQQAQRHPADPVLTVGEPWEGTSMHYVCVLREPEAGTFRMWYLTYNANAVIVPGTTPEISAMCYAESKDGIHWVKPKLGLVEYQGSRDNNIVFRPAAREFDSFSVIVRPEAPDPSRRFRIVIFQGALQEGEFAPGQPNYPLGHYALYSPDGVHWTPDWEHPVFPVRGENGSLDRTNFAWDPHSRKWVGFLKAYKDGKRVRRYSESTDFVNWTRPEYCLAPDERDAADVHFYGHYVWWYGTQYVGFLEAFHKDAGITDIQLISSRDGRNWDRVGDRSPFIPVGQEGTFDSHGVYMQGTTPLPVGDDIYYYYTGTDAPHDQGSKLGGVGLVTTKAGRYVAIKAGERIGELMTKPVRFAGGQLLVNADATGGSLRVELQRPSGRVIPGFGRAECKGIASDGLSHRVQWQGNPALPQHKRVQLVFELHNARLFAFCCEET